MLEASKALRGRQRQRRRAEDPRRHGRAGRGAAWQAQARSGGRATRRRASRRRRAPPPAAGGAAATMQHGPQRSGGRRREAPSACRRRANRQRRGRAGTRRPSPHPSRWWPMRGDDRPGMKKAEPMPAGRGGKFGDRKRRAGRRPGARGEFEPRRPRTAAAASATTAASRTAARAWATRPSAPSARRSSTRSRRLRKLAAQAHGEALTQLMTAWEQRVGRAGAEPAGAGQGRGAARCARSWVQALAPRRAGDAGEAAAAPGDRRRSADAGRAHRRPPHAATAVAHPPQRPGARADLGRRTRPACWPRPTTRGAARRLQNVLKALLRGEAQRAELRCAPAGLSAGWPEEPVEQRHQRRELRRKRGRLTK